MKIGSLQVLMIYKFLQIQTMTSTVDVFKDLFCGCLNGWGQVVSMLPFENIKIKVISKPDEYNQGFIHALRKTIQEEGMLSLYKGMLFPLIGVGAQVSVQFGIVQTLKKIMKTKYADQHGHLAPKYSFISGVLSGVPSALVVTPLDHARFKVTLEKKKGMGSIGMAKKIYKEHGITKLYSGFNSTALRDSIGLGCYFWTYDFLIRYFTNQEGRVNLLGSLLSGGCAGVSFWLFNYPIDYVKTIIQSDSLTNPKYRSNWHCAVETAKKGPKVFYTAFDIMMARSVVANSFGFLWFQIGKRMLY